MPVISERTMIFKSNTLLRQSLLAAKLPKKAVAELSENQICHIKDILRWPENSAKTKAFESLFDNGQISLIEADKAFASVYHIWKKLDLVGNRKFTLFLSDDNYSLIPHVSLVKIVNILGWNFSSLSQGLDYDNASGRSAYFDMHEPVSVEGSTLHQIKLKGVCFDADRTPSPFKVPDEPKGAMYLKAAINEFSMMGLAFKKGGDAICPLGYGNFLDASYNNSPLGFVVYGMDGKISP
jgi:hypothetical protein